MVSIPPLDQLCALRSASTSIGAPLASLTVTVVSVADLLGGEPFASATTFQRSLMSQSSASASRKMSSALEENVAPAGAGLPGLYIHEASRRRVKSLMVAPPETLSETYQEFGLVGEGCEAPMVS